MDKLLAWALPAIRYTRIPLVVGYAWLLNVWLIVDWVFGSELARDDRTDLVARIVVATDVIGEFGQGLAISLLAFLIGELITHYLEKLLDAAIGASVQFVDLNIEDQRVIVEGRFRIYLALSLIHISEPTRPY